MHTPSQNPNLEDRLYVMIDQMLFLDQHGNDGGLSQRSMEGFGLTIVELALQRGLITKQLKKFSDYYSDFIYQLAPNLQWRYGWTADNEWNRSWFAT